MKEKPILFRGPMVRAILDGRKTQTRLVIRMDIDGGKMNPDAIGFTQSRNYKECWYMHDRFGSPIERFFAELKCPYGQPGDRLWVRETWMYDELGIRYRAQYTNKTEAWRRGPWKPSTNMPRKYCRLLLDVKAVRVERLHDISDADVRAEGIPESAIEWWRKWLHPNDAPGKAFGELWDSLNKKRGFRWDTNPWVWVIEFEKVEEPQ